MNKYILIESDNKDKICNECCFQNNIECPEEHIIECTKTENLTKVFKKVCENCLGSVFTNGPGEIETDIVCPICEGGGVIK